MYSVFLVEDEALMRDGIRTLVDWNKFGFAFAGEAPDGEMAWPLIQKHKPDIVITDIKMPFMDGLALTRLIKKELPETTVIILSGYDEFDYARQAISLGVSRYLLKPLSKEQLVEVLVEAREQRQRQDAKNRYLTQFEGEVQEYLTSSRRGFFDALVSGKHTPSELLARAERMGISLTAERYNMVLFLLQENLLESGYSAQLATIQADLCEGFLEDDALLLFSMGVDMIAFLVKGDASTIEQRTQQCAQRIRAMCRPLQTAVSWSVALGSPVCRLSAVPECYRSVRKQLFQTGAATESGASMDFDPADMDAEKLDQRIIEKFLASGLPEDVHAFVQDYFEAIGLNAMESMIFRQYIVLNIQFTVNAFLEKLGYAQNAASAPRAGQLHLSQALNDLASSCQYSEELLRRALQMRQKAVMGRYDTMLKNAQAYMREHFQNPEINLNAVAQVANVSPTHFSAVFSQQTGRTFVEYLTALRMEKAKELLRCTDNSSGEIAFAVGYNDPHYFSFLFKKVNGCSPRDFRAGRSKP